MKKSFAALLVMFIVLALLPAAVEAQVPVKQAGDTPVVAVTKPIPTFFNLMGWRIQLRKDVPHSFGRCVASPVAHFHVELFKCAAGRCAYVSNFHIGSYTNYGRRCFVVFNNYKPYMCTKSCAAGDSGARYVIKTALIMVAAAAGVALSATVAAGLAALAAPALSGVLP